MLAKLSSSLEGSSKLLPLNGETGEQVSRGARQCVSVAAGLNVGAEVYVFVLEREGEG